MFVTIVLLLIAGVFSLQYKPVQTYVAKKAAGYLSKELKTTVSLSSIYVKPFKSVVIEDLLVLDQQKDTLLNTSKFLVDMNQLSLEKRIIDVHTVQINQGKFFLKNYKNNTSNLDFIIDYFDTGKPPKKKAKKPYEIKFNQIILNNLSFKYKNYRKKDTLINGINYDDISLRNLNGVFEDLNTKNHLLQTNIKNLTFREKSGFYLKNLSALTTVDTNAIELKNLNLVTNQSRLTDYYQMRFNSFKDFNHYVSKVRMKAVFKNSHIASKDIAYFAPGLKNMHLDLEVDGKVSGLVNDLKAKKLSIKAGKATYIKGDYILKGLPNWKETFIDLKIEMAATNKRDLDEILGNTTGKTVKYIPEIVDKFGNINFNGSFTGFQNDFVAFGEFKTKLGRLQSDVNMQIDKAGTPHYTGNVKTYDFDLGNLLNEKTLGKITSTLYVKGKGTEVKNLTEKINGDVKYLDFNKYRYSNVKVDGVFDKKNFKGRLSVNDKNLNLIFDGGVNLNSKLPVFNFKASVRNAKLNALKLYKDSLKVDADFSTNFSGTNLNNIQGNLLVEKIKLQNKNGIFDVEKVQLQANGLGINRALTINSDILDASIKGDYDLSTIISYYKAIAKTYVPSLETKIYKYANQIFQFNLKIKRFEPIAQILVPGLEIEDQAVFVGNFDSRNNTATLNGYVKKLKYKGVTVNNIILDESTTKDQLQMVVTSDRVNLNDSLFIKNVNIANILRRDSLSLNIKLSNADDANQLDLNGLVEFTKNQDTIARLSILPSTLSINKEDWKIQDKVRISFNNGKTQITNFDLSNGNQIITVDGLISEDPKDLIEVGFKDFNLKTLNPVVKAFGVNLSGKVNGKTNLFGVLKSLRFSDDLFIDSLTFNKTYIGSLRDTSSFDNQTKKINVFTNIIADNKENLKVSGNVNLKEKLLDLRLVMDETKLAILEPFVHKLVSNLKGNISSDLNIIGTFEKPKINGEVAFNKAQVTVNYLKTAYNITDKVTVDNSVIRINNITLKDIDNNEANAEGTVDLNNINDPTLNVTVYATNFMALNTTSKDNALYYGKAYGTGVFKFKGPTSKMFIDINAKTEKGTVFNLPLNSSETISDKDFIHFISKDTTQNFKKNTSFDGLTMRFKLNVDPNSIANIYTVLGNLSGKGNGELNLNINSLGDFEMYGDYIIETGSFNFTAQEVINKKFDIRKGGTIRWTGNPTAAQINLEAIYAVKASLADLYKATNQTTQSNTYESENTEVTMGLSGLLLKPNIKLDVNFPSKDRFQAYFNTEDNRKLQAISLIVLRKFASGTGSESFGAQLGTGAKSTAAELFFNQVTSILSSSLNLNFVDLNIRSANDANASFKFFNDRLIINAGIASRNNTDALTFINFSKNTIAREVEALVLVKKDGSFVGKLANKPPTQQSIFVTPGINPNANVTSVGLIYNQQFDSLKEFVQKISGYYKQELRKKQQQNPIQHKSTINKEAIQNQEKNNQRK